MLLGLFPMTWALLAAANNNVKGGLAAAALERAVATGGGPGERVPGPAKRGVTGGAANRMDTMKLGISAALALLLGTSTALLLAACGSATKTVSVAGSPPVSQTASTATHPPGTTSTASTTPAAPAVGSGGGTPAPAGTRTAPEPAFTEKEDSAEGLSAATAVLRAKGFTPTSTSVYHPNQTLRVLIGTRSGSSDGYGQQAFFFVNGRYIGTDAKEPSATVGVISQSDTEVTLAYPLYRKGDALSGPSGGVAKVRFQLNNGQLEPLDPIPPATSATGRLTRQ